MLSAGTSLKLVPVIVTTVFASPDVGEIELIVGGYKYVKIGPIAEPVLQVTVTTPVLPPEGTIATSLVVVELVTVAMTPLNLTELVEIEFPKLVPLIVTEIFAVPAVGLMDTIFGLGSVLSFLHEVNITIINNARINCFMASKF